MILMVPASRAMRLTVILGWRSAFGAAGRALEYSGFSPRGTSEAKDLISWTASSQRGKRCATQTQRRPNPASPKPSATQTQRHPNPASPKPSATQTLRHPNRTLSPPHGKLVQPFLPSQISERTDVRESEDEAEQILIAYVGDGIAAVLQRHTTAIPVVGSLPSREL